MDNMEDFNGDERDSKGKKKVKEYYQINLDMGRIFWIVFILGLVIIGIFVLGFYIGGNNKKTGISINNISKKSVQKESLKEDESANTSNEISIEELFKGESAENVKKEQTVKAEKGSQEITSFVEKKPISSLKSTEREKKRVSTVKSSKSGYSRKKTYSGGKYYIQVASFSKKENAYRLKKELEKHLYKVKIERVTINGKSFYRVRVGPFTSKMVASNTMLSMKKRFKLESPFVVKKSS